MDIIKRYEVEREEDWQGWIGKIPGISFPQGWLVQVIPPTVGALARFRVKKDGGENWVSVYLDVYNRLGFTNGPYWEVYPVDDDVERCDMDEVEELVKIITKALEQVE